MEEGTALPDEKADGYDFTKNTADKPYVVYVGKVSDNKEYITGLLTKSEDEYTGKKVPVVTDEVIDNIECYVCDQCGNTFFALDTLKAHYKVHLGRDCNLCGKSLASLKSRWKHFLYTHLGIKNNVCNVCGKAFATTSNLNEHYLTHTGEKPYTCGICEKSFASSKTRSNHLHCHTGEKPYACSDCNKHYAQLGSLNFHIRSHHFGLKPYNCHLCYKNFASSSGLRKHILKKICQDDRQIVNCSVCNKKVIKKYLLKHAKAHTVDKTNSCNICKRSFEEKSILVRHLLAHSQKEKFACKVCHQTFALHRTLKKHAYSHREKKTFNCEVSAKSFGAKGK